MTKPSDTTQFALMGKDISQIQKDMTIMSGNFATLSNDVRILTNSRFVTESQMSMAMAALKAELKTEIKDENKWFKTLGTTIFAAILVSIAVGITNFLIRGGFKP